jgi:uncharacterized repeat protein (TIGR01451 family)
MATFFNQATLSYNGGSISSNITSGEIIEVLSATKTAVVDEYVQGDEITYVINIVNAGSTPFTNLTLTDNLGSYDFGTPAITLYPLDYVDGSVKYFADGVLQPTPPVTAGPPLQISGITVPANGVATVAYTVSANEFAPPDEAGIITNVATVDGGGLTTPITATETVSASVSPEFSITKSVSPTTVAENDQVTYTFVIENTGNTAAIATDNVTVTDVFDPSLANITVTYNGAPWSEGTDYTYNEATGLFATVAGKITVPAATFTQDPITGAYATAPGIATVTVTGTI